MPEDGQNGRREDVTRILVADDDSLIQEVMKTKLEKSGYAVQIAGDGDATLSAIADQMPDLLILDIKMPGVDGIEICRRLRKDEAGRMLPILMLTAYGGIDHIIRGLEAGADDYVTKPFHIEEVLIRIKSLLRVRQIEKELREKETGLARIETMGQLLVTMAHHINNSLAVISGRAQALRVDDQEQVQKMKDACLKQSRRIEAVLHSLQSVANQMKVSTTSYAGRENAMMDIEAEIARRLEEAGKE